MACEWIFFLIVRISFTLTFYSFSYKYILLYFTKWLLPLYFFLKNFKFFKVIFLLIGIWNVIHTYKSAACKFSCRDSCQRGWRLFSIVAAYFECSEALKPYLFKYLETAAYDKRRAYHGKISNTCVYLKKVFHIKFFK